MELHTTSWEYPLLAQAFEALDTGAMLSPTAHISGASGRDERQDAYDYCARIVRANSRTFDLAAHLMPSEKRRAIHALYAFCRATDDLVDKAASTSEATRLQASWQERLQGCPNAYDPVALAWADTQARYQIPHGYVAQLMKGITRDLYQQRYATFVELAEYCYGVASTVGLMVMHIIGFYGAAALPYAVKLGIALQLTNILRDVGDDWRAGRLYLPLDELAQFHLSEDDIAAGRVDDHWRAFMRYQIARARRLYQEAEPGIALLHPEGRFAIAAASSLYRAILEDIEAHDYDIFSRRAHIGLFGKLRRLPGIWWRGAHLGQPSLTDLDQPALRVR